MSAAIGQHPRAPRDPRLTLSNGPMTRAQVLVIAISICLTALDGFDVLAISFAAPGIARDWGVDRAALGAVLSMELIGMALGSILIGNVADRIGRRRTVLGCLATMACGMALTAAARNVWSLSLCRVLTGIGIGGLLVAATAVAAEFSSQRLRDLGISLMATGYPLGVIGGGSVAAVMLRHETWHAIFEFGAAITAVFIPIVLLWLPESVLWLCERQPPGALAWVNRSLLRLGLAPIEQLPPKPPPAVRTGWRRGILRPGLAGLTVLLTLTYFLHITTFYFLAKWVPKIVVDLGFAPASAAGVLVWTNVGGATGGAVLGLLTRRFAVRPFTIVLMIASTVMVIGFGRVPANLHTLSLVCALAGFCTNGAIVGIYAVLAHAYPTELRAGGTGFAIGVGRGGALLAPILAGVLFQTGFSLQAVCLIMGSGSLIAAILLSRVRTERTTLESEQVAH